MTSRPRNAGTVDFATIALPVLCSLLAAILYFASDMPQSPVPKPEPAPPAPPDLTALEEKEQRLSEQIKAAQQRRDALLARLDRCRQDADAQMNTQNEFAALHNHLAVLDARIKDLLAKKGELEKQIDQHGKRLADAQKARRDIEKARQEIAAINERIAKLEVPKSDTTLGLIGSYKGPYVLVECIDKAVLVYLPKRDNPEKPDRRIAMDAPKADIDWLLGEVPRVGCVVLVARPDGWFNNSYRKFNGLFRDYLENRPEGEKAFKFASFPTEATEPIANFVWKGAK